MENQSQFTVFSLVFVIQLTAWNILRKWIALINVRTVISKVPFKLRDKLKGVACDMQDRRRMTARFLDLVGFLDKQAKVMLHPFFGKLQEPAFSNHVNEMLQESRGKKNIH